MLAIRTDTQLQYVGSDTLHGQLVGQIRITAFLLLQSASYGGQHGTHRRQFPHQLYAPALVPVNGRGIQGSRSGPQPRALTQITDPGTTPFRKRSTRALSASTSTVQPSTPRGRNASNSRHSPSHWYTNQHQLIQAVGAMPQPTGVAGRPSQCSPCRSRETQAYESYLMPGKATQDLRHRQIWREPSTGMCLTWNYFRQTATKTYQERANTGSEYGIGARPLNGRKRNKTPRPTPCKATFCNVT